MPRSANAPAAASAVQEPTSSSAAVPLRDWFAGQALVGLIPAPAQPGVLSLSTADMARMAYQYADAMMKARNN